jgi:hypothetical protein
MVRPWNSERSNSRPTDLFWIPPDGQGEVHHSKFDQAIQQISSQTFEADNPDEAIRAIFSNRPNQIFEGSTTTGSDTRESVPCDHRKRSALPFRDGFCAEICLNPRRVSLQGCVMWEFCVSNDPGTKTDQLSD